MVPSHFKWVTFPSLDWSISACLPSLDGRGLRGG